VTTKDNKAKPSPRSSKSGPIGGIVQGVGIPAQVGTRPGTFTHGKNKDLKVSKAIPPLKFN
jgi:hypothetical protein